MSYHYTYIPRFDPEPAEEEDAEPVNPWLASPPSPPVPAPEPVNAWMGLPPSPHAFNAWVGSPPSPAIIIPLVILSLYVQIYKSANIITS